MKDKPNNRLYCPKCGDKIEKANKPSELQKIISVRCSRSGLAEALLPYTKEGWKVVSTEQGSEWTRILHTYKWTVVLERIDTPNEKESITDELEKAHKLYSSGAITLEEYSKLKEKILAK